MTPLIIALLSVACFEAQVVLHECAHGRLVSKRISRVAGHALACSQLVHFDGYRAAHVLHHRYTNTARDPQSPGSRGLLEYVLTFYFRVARAVWRPRPFVIALVPFVAALSAAPVATAVYWLLPVALAQFAVAAVAYGQHAGLPPTKGANTRDFGSTAMSNWLTGGFFRHAEHHAPPYLAGGL